MPRALRRLLITSLAVLAISMSLEAAGHDMDISLGRLAYPCRGTTRPDGSCQQAFHNLMREYSFAFAPKILSPAETLGYDGFYVGLEGSLTPVDNTAGYMKDGTMVHGSSDSVLFVPALRLRKGLPWSFELSGTFDYMANTEMVAIGGDLKWSLFEGFRRGSWKGVPDVAVRGSVVKQLGSPDIDMTIAGVDGSISWSFAVSGQVVLTPYAGYQFLWSFVFAESVVVGKNNKELLNPMTQGTEAVFQFEKENLIRSRPFAGFRFIWEHFSFTPEVSIGAGDGKVSVQPAFSVGADF